MQKNIAVLAGDGIGPEIIAQAKKVLDKIAEVYHHQFNYSDALIGAAAIDHTGQALPKETLSLCLNSDAILFGCIGHPKFDNDPKAPVRPEQGLLALRKQLGLFANLRPIKSYELLEKASPLKSALIKDIDILFCRELSSGLYFGKPSERSADGNSAVDTCSYTRMEILRITKLAFEYARGRKNKVTLVDKANVLATSQLWREVVTEYAAQNDDVEFETMFVDNAAMKLIQQPSHFDVILTENLFGDILSDEASVITGSLGMLPSASLGENTSLFEPVHGSYPQATGKNTANPFATILSAAMLLEYAFDMNEEGKAIRNAVDKAINQGFVTEDLNSSNYSCSAVGDFVAGEIS